MQLSEMRNLVVEATGRDDKLSLIDSSINLGIEEVSKARGWNDLRVEDVSATLLTGARTVTLATDTNRLAVVRVTDNSRTYRLRLRTEDWVLKTFPDLENYAPQRPVFGYLRGNVLHLGVAADKDYPLRYSYYKRHPKLVGDTDELLVLGGSSAIIAYATHWVFLSLQQLQEAATWEVIYSRRLKELKREDSSDSAVEQIGDGRGEELAVPPDYWLDPFVIKVP